MSEPATTDGTLLGGRVAYRQPAQGYRTGIEPVLLAAAVPARPGDRVLEAGTGAGAGLLALSARVAGLAGLGLESDPEMAALALANFATNGFGTLQVAVQDITQWRADTPYDHAMANPPWHSRAGTRSPEPRRLAAKFAGDGLLERWSLALAGALRRRGTLTLILPASSVTRGIAALTAASCPEIAVQPLWPQSGQPARLAILTGVRHGRGPARLLPGLTLHEPAGGYTVEAERILRLGARLDTEPRRERSPETP